MKINEFNIYQGDCLELMKDIPDRSVDMILCDLPYGMTKCKWDVVIPFEPLWNQYNRIIKENGAIVLFGSEPFSTILRSSNIKNYKYDWIWIKTQPSNFFNAKKMPLRSHENVSVFYSKQPTYNPQKTIKKDVTGIGRTRHNSKNKIKNSGYPSGNTGKVSEEAGLNYSYTENGSRYPIDVVYFSNWNGIVYGNAKNAVKHSTQKPIQLLEYLIKTYTNEGEIVLDNCMGSGSTGVACAKTNRKFIGIELDETFFKIAKERIENSLDVSGCTYHC